VGQGSCSKGQAGIRPQKVYIGDYPYTGSGSPGSADSNHGSGSPGSADPNHPYTYIKRFINRIEPFGGTGTAIAMWEAYDYFKQSNDHNYSNGFDIANPNNVNDLYKDPLYVCDSNGQNCATQTGRTVSLLRAPRTSLYWLRTVSGT